MAQDASGEDVVKGRSPEMPGQMQRDLAPGHAPEEEEAEPDTVRPGDEEERSDRPERVDEQSDVHEHDDAAVDIGPDERGDPDPRATD